MSEGLYRRARTMLDKLPVRSKSSAVAVACIIAALGLAAILSLQSPDSPRAPAPAKQSTRHLAEPRPSAPATPTTALAPSAKSPIAPPAPAKPAVAKPPIVVQPAAKPPEVDRLAVRLRGEYPELTPETPEFRELGDWEKVIRLRDFSYRHTAFACSPDSAAHQAAAEMVRSVVDGKATVADAYEFFDRACGGATSGEAAQLLQRLYAWAGYDAYYLEIGVPQANGEAATCTYAVTLVRVKVLDGMGKQHSLLSVQDPSLNLSYGDSQGKPIDYFEMLERLARRQADEIHFMGEVPAQGNRRDPVTVASNADLERTRPADLARSWNLTLSPVWSATSDGNWSVRGPRTIWAYEELGDVTWKPQLFRAGFPPESIYRHCFPLVIRGTDASPALFERAQRALSVSTVAASGGSGANSHE